MNNPFVKHDHIDLAGLHVMVAMPTHRDLHPRTVIALLETKTALMARGIPCEVVITYDGSLVHHARTKLAREFLRSEANRLFWIDSDMVWTVEGFLRVLARSTQMGLVAAAYTAKQDPPLVMVHADDLQALQTNEHGCLAFNGLGLGFCCMTRAVVQEVCDAAPLRRFHNVPEPIPHPFEMDVAEDGSARGEDMAFFARAKAIGHQLWVDPSIQLGHVGQKVFTARLSDFLEAKAAAPSMDNATVSSAA